MNQDKALGSASPHLIGLDLGTTALKGILMSSEGIVVARETVHNEYDRKPDGSVEFDAERFYERVCGILRRLVAALPDKALLAGVSMASASGNTLLVDRRGDPILPAISWMDTRVTDEMGRVFGKLDEAIVHERVGWSLLAMFPLAHLSWLRCHRAEQLDRADRVCMTTDHVNFRLTGEWGIDPSTASTFYLQDQLRNRWHRPDLERLGIPVDKLPPIQASGTLLGSVTEKASRETGLPKGTPVLLGAFDHPCAARGTKVLEPGTMLLSCGTSWVGFYPVEDRGSAIRQGMLVDPFLRPAGPWGAMFSLPSIGERIDGLIRRHIASTPDRYRVFDGLAASASPGAGGLFVDPLREERIPDADLYSRPDIARAIMEGTCHLLKRRMDSLREAGIAADAIALAGGPSETHPWPQILSDVLGMDLTVRNGSCAGAAGAAILAGIGVGLYASESDAWRRLSFRTAVRRPDRAAHRIYQERSAGFEAHVLKEGG
jgi:xylulokinase